MTLDKFKDKCRSIKRGYGFCGEELNPANILRLFDELNKAARDNGFVHRCQMIHVNFYHDNGDGTRSGGASYAFVMIDPETATSFEV